MHVFFSVFFINFPMLIWLMMAKLFVLYCLRGKINGWSLVTVPPRMEGQLDSVQVAAPISCHMILEFLNSEI
jgi:hypothetical protein